MYAALNGFSCPDYGFSAIAPPFFVFRRATHEKIYFPPRQSVLSATLSQIGLQEMADEKLEIFVLGPDSHSC